MARAMSPNPREHQRSLRGCPRTSAKVQDSMPMQHRDIGIYSKPYVMVPIQARMLDPCSL